MLQDVRDIPRSGLCANICNARIYLIVVIHSSKQHLAGSTAFLCVADPSVLFAQAAAIREMTASMSFLL